MDLYTQASYDVSRLITQRYSTSFGLSIRLFEASLRPHIYAIYGLVRIADEIVDTYAGPDRLAILDSFQAQTMEALATGYSTNPVVHAFVQTATQFAIDDTLIAPFFDSMRMDITPQLFDQQLYDRYIYGSAEVVGLMCLKVFTGDENLYRRLEKGASKLGAAYQKVNFLRDIAADAGDLDRWYFPLSSFKDFDEKTKAIIVRDIEKDLVAADRAITKLPDSSRKAVRLSYLYYSRLLAKIKQTPAAQLQQERIRVSTPEKSALLVRTILTRSSRV